MQAVGVAGAPIATQFKSLYDNPLAVISFENLQLD